MKIADALASVQQLYIETAPIIYYAEDHHDYSDKMQAIFLRVNMGSIEAVTSVITLTETLAKPLKTGDKIVEQAYRSLLQHTQNIRLIPIDADVAERAADFRARYNLRTPDALHLATALASSCQAFLTNDLTFRRVSELSILILDDLELGEHEG